MKTHRFSGIFLPFVFVLLVAAIFAGGYVHYLDLKKRIESDGFETLAAIADLKAGQITRWMDEQRSHAEVLRADRLLAKEVRSGTIRDQRAYLAALKQYYDYRSIVLIDPKGAVSLSVGEEVRTLDETSARLAAEAAACGCVVFSDFQGDEAPVFDAAPQKIHLDLLVPLRVLISGKERGVGVLRLRIDPHTYFYRLLQSWPNASASAETLLVRAQGQDVVFLNELRHQKNTALSLRMPLESTDQPAAMVARGLQGGVGGTDYRGVAVLADLRPIPGTSWSMVVKVDAQELFAPLARSGRVILSVALLLVVGAATIVFLIWLQQKGAAHQSEHAQAQRAAGDKQLESLILSVSQELRGPLGKVDGDAQQLQETWPEGMADKRLALDRIRTSVLSMDQRLDDLLSFSRLSSAPLNPEKIPMSGLVQSVYDELRAADPGRQVRWELRPLPAAQGDPILVRELVRNLLGNAFKFTRNRKTAKIEAGALPAYMGRDGYRTFFVKDNGMGFDLQQHAGRLFGIFQRLHDLQDLEGSGMGLAIAKQIVERHGGKIWAQSSPDDGAVLFFTLPSNSRGE